MALLTAAVFKSDYLNTTDEDQDESITRILDRAQSAIESYLRRSLELQQRPTEYLDGDGENKSFYLKYCPVAVVSRVVVDDTEMEVDTDYYLYEEEGMLVFETAPSSGRKNIEVDYWAGYSNDNELYPDIEGPPELPKVIEDAMYTVAMRIWKNSTLGESNEGLSSRSADGGSITYKDSFISPDIKDALAKYRKWNL